VTVVSVWVAGIAFSGSDSSLESLEVTGSRLAIFMRGEVAKVEPRVVTRDPQERSHVAGGGKPIK
jgi:hypothetical protein